MSARELLPPAPTQPGAVFIGKVSRANDDGTVGVTLDAYGDTHEWPPARWVAAGQTPARGDVVLVLIDDAGGTWALPSAAAPAPQYDGLQEGILVATDCALTVDTTAQVTIAAGTVYVRNAAGLLVRTTPAATTLSGIPAASASNFRLDQVVESAEGVLSRLAGTQGAGVTIANRTGHATVPAGSRLLHDLLVTSAGVLVANVRDRRPWARGAKVRIQRNTGDYSTSSLTFAELDATNLKPRVECTGVPLRIRLQGSLHNNSGGATATTAVFVPLLDGASVDGMPGVGTSTAIANGGYRTTVHAQNYSAVNPIDHTTIPAAGSHLVSVAWGNDAAVGVVLRAQAVQPCALIIEEDLRPSATNGT